MQLQHALDAANARVADLENTYQEQVKIQEDFQTALEKTIESARAYFLDNQRYLESLNKHYSDQLQLAREETREAEATHRGWQAAFSRVNECVNEAHNSMEEGSLPYRRRIAALKEENRLLRAKAGWDPPIDSDSDEWDDEEGLGDDMRGRGSRTSQPGSGSGQESLVLT